MADRGHYELPHSGHNGIELVGTFAYEDAILRALPRLPADGASVEAHFTVDLVPEPDNPHDRRAVSVRHRGEVLGYLSRDLAADYHLPVKRILASGARLQTGARVFAHLSWDDKPEVRVYVGLPAPDALTPLNDGYPAATAVLPYGRTYQVTKEDQHFEHLFDYVPRSGQGPVILTLHKSEAMLRNGTVRRTVEVRLDAEKAGELTAATSAHYLPVIEHAEALGRVVGVWGTITGSGLAAELTIKGAKSSELTDEWLREMPIFPHLVPESHSYDVPDAYQGPGMSPAKAARALKLPTARGSHSLTAHASIPEASRPAAASKRAPKTDAAQPPAAPRPERLTDAVVRLGDGTGLRRPVYYAVKGKQVYLDDRDRATNARSVRRMAWALIVGVVLVGLLLGQIPGIGPLFFLAAIAYAWIGGRDQLRKAAALEADAGDLQDREWGALGEESQDADGDRG